MRTRLPRWLDDRTLILYQVLNGIQTGPYRNIYNPENFFNGRQGTGAGNNWAAGYAAGEGVQEEIFDMIDREADGSDSLEVEKKNEVAYETLTVNRVSCCCIPLPEGLALDWAVSSWNE